MERGTGRTKIAVIGAGAAGITSACLLQDAHDITLYEKSAGLGGHAQSVTIDNGMEPPFDVDTAFVIFNSVSYPLLLKLLARFGVQDRVQRTEMSFSYLNPEARIGYALNRGLRAMRPLVLPILYELFRFRRNAARDLAGRGIDLSGLTLSDYLARYRYSSHFSENFLYPTAVSVWSIPTPEIRSFPAISFLRFLDNHRYLGGSRGHWLTIEGGCQQYVRSFRDSFKGHVLTACDVTSVIRGAGAVEVRTADGRVDVYDKVILATHADQALRLLANPSTRERRLLGAWTYRKTYTVLHEDASVMPPDRKLWASWNIRYGSQGGARGAETGGGITYYLNRVQRLKSRKDYFVTLGGEHIPEKHVLARYHHEHPVFDFRSTATQRELPSLNGQQGTYFCGSYFGFGFHEDAIRSAVDAASLLGASPIL